MRITVLGSGTSQGVPVITCQCPTCQSKDSRDKRLRSSILIETPKVTVVVDAGPDFRQQMLNEDICHLDAILITHEHKDHIGGLDDVRSYNFAQKISMPIYASASAQEEIKREYSYAFGDDPYPGVPTYNLITLDETPFDLGDLHIVPIKLDHFKMTSYAFRIGKFAYVTDLRLLDENGFKKLEGIDYLIIEALRQEKHYSHLCLPEAIEIAQQLNVKKAWFTHVSHLMGKAIDLNPTLPDNMALAYDGMKIEI